MDSKMDMIDKAIMYKTALIRRKKLDVSDVQQAELSEELDSLRERKDALESLNSTEYDNYHRHKRNLYPIKSSTNVHNHSRPCNRRSKQPKLHVGLGQFCAKKPPKTENDVNELTHHQQAHKKNIIHLFCDAEREDEARHVVEISMDDKAYPCQGASTGMSGARNQEIYQPSNNEKGR